MESVAVFLVGVAMVWLVFWAVRNDGARSIRDQRGLFRMRVPPEPAATAAAGPDESQKDEQFQGLSR